MAVCPGGHTWHETGQQCDPAAQALRAENSEMPIPASATVPSCFKKPPRLERSSVSSGSPPPIVMPPSCPLADDRKHTFEGMPPARITPMLLEATSAATMQIGSLVTHKGRPYYLRGLDPMSVSDRQAELEDAFTGARVFVPLDEVEDVKGRDPERR